MTSLPGTRQPQLTRPGNLQLSTVIVATPEPLVDDRFSDLRGILDQLPFAPEDHVERPPADGPARSLSARVLDASHVRRQAILAMSIVVLVGLAYLAAVQSAP